MQIKALLFDIGRNNAGNLQYLKHVVDNISGMGYNMLVINLEHRFKTSRLYSAAPQASLSADDATALCSYGTSKSVEIVPFVNLCGHMEGMMATEYFSELSADPLRQLPWGGYEQLDLRIPQSRKLVENFLDAVLEAFPGDYIHIGLDEIRRLEYLVADKHEKQRELLIEFFAYLLSLAEKSGKTVLVWADMIQKYPDLLRHIPPSEKLILCCWDYEPAGCRKELEKLISMNYRVLACPGIHTFDDFAIDSVKSSANIAVMHKDALDLNLDGILLTTWEFGAGSGFGVVWPWIDYTGKLFNGTADKWEIAKFAEKYFACSGKKIAKLTDMLDKEFKSIFSDVKLPSKFFASLRKELFRGYRAETEIARANQKPENYSREPWEISPFNVWLYARDILTEKRMEKLKQLAAKVDKLAGELLTEVAENRDDFHDYYTIACALVIMTHRFETLNNCKLIYQQASVAQSKNDQELFNAKLAKTADLLNSLASEIAELKTPISTTVKNRGIDKNEIKWLELQNKALNEHVASLKERKIDDDALIEFGEFLKRPADLQNRLLWR